MSLPVGFTEDSLPVGLQICAGPRAEHNVLTAAHSLEQLLQLTPAVPIEPLSPA